MATQLDELQILLNKSSEEVAKLLSKLGEIMAIEKITGRPQTQLKKNATANLGDMFRRMQGVADLLGRKKLLQEVEGKQEFSENFVEAEDVDTPKEFSLEKIFEVSFNKIIDQILKSSAFNSVNREEIKEEINEVYGDNVPVLNFPGVSEAKDDITNKLDKIVLTSLATGISQEKAIKQIQDEIQDWSGGIGQTIYRTKTAQANADGRLKQLENPIIRNRVAGIQYLSVNDSSARPTHKALHKKVWAVRDPIWKKVLPPWDFNCRCTFKLVSFRDMDRMNKLDKSKASSIFPKGEPIFDSKPSLENAVFPFGNRELGSIYAGI